VGPICQVDGGTRLSGRLWVIMDYEKSKEKKIRILPPLFLKGEQAR
jgi:hypothetical protein